VLEKLECRAFHLVGRIDERPDIANKVGVNGACGEAGKNFPDLRRAIFFDQLEQCPGLRWKSAQNGCIHVDWFCIGQIEPEKVEIMYVRSNFTVLYSNLLAGLAAG
jgi:hypothetical protein